MQQNGKNPERVKLGFAGFRCSVCETRASFELIRPGPGSRQHWAEKNVSAAGASCAGFARKFTPAQSDFGLSAADQSVAGAISKATTKFALYPLDTWKIRLQVAPRGAGTSLAALSWRGVYRGLLPKLALYSPYQAVYMATYTRSRDFLSHDGSPLSGSIALFAVAGIIAEICGSAVRLPMEVSKMRLQLGIYSNTWRAALDVMRRPRQVYGLFVPQTLMHDCLYSACSWIVFEGGRQHLFAHRDTANIAVHETLVLGALAGGISALTTNPFDVIKTRLVADTTSCGRPSVKAAVVKIVSEEGPLFFWRGSGFRIAHLAPASGVYMVLYEFAKGRIALWRSDDS